MADIEQLKQLKIAYEQIFKDEHGKKVLVDLEGKYYIDRTNFNNDALSLAFSEGQRTVVLYIKAMLKLNIEKLEGLNADTQEGK